jgi:hypothetical protein
VPGPLVWAVGQGEGIWNWTWPLAAKPLVSAVNVMTTWIPAWPAATLLGVITALPLPPAGVREAVGVALGVPLGVALGVPLGVLLAVPVGVGVGVAACTSTLGWMAMGSAAVHSGSLSTVMV